MFCDERLEKIEQLVSNSLNENAAAQKVCVYELIVRHSYQRDCFVQGGLGAVNSRVYAVKVIMIATALDPM